MKNTNLFNYWMVIQGNATEGWKDLGVYRMDDKQQMQQYKEDIKHYRSSTDYQLRSVRRKKLRTKAELMSDCGLTEEEAEYKIEKYGKKY